MLTSLTSATRRWLIVVLSSTAPALTGCGKTTAPEPLMTDAEAAALVQGLYGGELLVHGEIFHLGPYPAPVLLPDPLVNATIPCADGGGATFKGVAASRLHTGQVTAEVSGSLAAKNCAFRSDGLRLVVDSDGLAQSIRVTLVPRLASILLEAESAGTLDWAAGQRSGRCEVANVVTSRIALEVVSRGAAPVAQISGTVCGREIDRELLLVAGS